MKPLRGYFSFIEMCEIKFSSITKSTDESIVLPNSNITNGL